MDMSKLVLDMDRTDILRDMIRTQGSDRHRFVAAHCKGIDIGAGRSLADIVHHLGLLHGRMPGLIDTLADRHLHPEFGDWLDMVATAMAVERTYMTRLVVAVGPLPSTPRQSESEANLNARKHAIETLATSDRIGCALGAAAALVLDWPVVRRLLDMAARRFGVEPPAPTLPDCAHTHAAFQVVETVPDIDRALTFGARQLLLQHHALWDLLQTREISRTMM